MVGALCPVGTWVCNHLCTCEYGTKGTLLLSSVSPRACLILCFATNSHYQKIVPCISFVYVVLYTLFVIAASISFIRHIPKLQHPLLLGHHHINSNRALMVIFMVVHARMFDSVHLYWPVFGEDLCSSALLHMTKPQKSASSIIIISMLVTTVCFII